MLSAHSETPFRVGRSMLLLWLACAVLPLWGQTTTLPEVIVSAEGGTVGLPGVVGQAGCDYFFNWSGAGSTVTSSSYAFVDTFSATMSVGPFMADWTSQCPVPGATVALCGQLGPPPPPGCSATIVPICQDGLDVKCGGLPITIVSSLPPGMENVPYTPTPTVFGGVSPTVAVDGLPGGLTADLSGHIVGTPAIGTAAKSPYQVVISASDSKGDIAGPVTRSLVISSSCQLPAPRPPAPFKQYAAAPQVTYTYTPQTQPYSNTEYVPQYFGLLPNPNPDNWVLCATKKAGCALSSLATMLDTFNDLPAGAPTSATDLDAQIKKEVGGYLVGTSYLCPVNQNCTSSPEEPVPFHDECEMDWFAPQAVAFSTVEWIDGQEANNGQLNDGGMSVSINQYLTDHVCKHQDRVVLELNETVDNAALSHPHFIFVEGQAATQGGTDWTVFDPGWSNAPLTLNGHLNGFTDKSGYQRSFTVAGVRTYRDISSSGNGGAFNVTANSPVELLVVDPTGNRLGNADGTDVFEIANGSYVRDFPLADDVETGVSNGDPSGIKTANVPSPSAGNYEVTATGTTLGTYVLRFRTLDTTGNLAVTTLSGIASIGSSISYQATISSSSGLSAPPVLMATFQSTNADINNGLSLGLIDNAGIANALSSKIRAAQSAAAAGQNQTAVDIVGAFENQVNAQTGKHISDFVAQVLLADATSLITQYQ